MLSKNNFLEKLLKKESTALENVSYQVHTSVSESFESGFNGHLCKEQLSQRGSTVLPGVGFLLWNVWLAYKHDFMLNPNSYPVRSVSLPTSYEIEN